MDIAQIDAILTTSHSVMEEGLLYVMLGKVCLFLPHFKFNVLECRYEL